MSTNSLEDERVSLVRGRRLPERLSRGRRGSGKRRLSARNRHLQHAMSQCGLRKPAGYQDIFGGLGPLYFESHPMPLPIIALALAAFAIGTTEFVIMGILPNVAQDLSVSIPQAGFLVSGYALGVALGAPLFAALTSRMDRKVALLLLMGIFIAGNVCSAISPSYGLLLTSRVITSFAHGSFFGIGAVVAASLVPPAQRASAVALMFTGLTLANVLGVPLGTLIGQLYGWRATFWIIALLGAIAIISVFLLVPRKSADVEMSLRQEVRVLKDPPVLLALATTVFGFGGIFTAFTFITPILQDVTHFTPHAVTWLLLLFGVGLTIGNTLGGKLADWRLMPTLIVILVSLAVVEVLFGLGSHEKVETTILIFAWGVAAFATVPGLQLKVVNEAAAAPNLASTPEYRCL